MAKIIAEIGCNHQGNYVLARKMIEVLADCGVDYVKFQKRTVKPDNRPHPNPINAFGKTYGEHREWLEFLPEQHVKLKEHCEEKGVKYACSVWDLQATKDIVSLNPDYIKIPSACNLDFEMLEYILDNYKGGIHISLGMTSDDEEAEIIKRFINKAKDNVIFYACTSAYPVKFADVCLKELEGSWISGFSGHHLGIAVDIAALTLGAEYIERHFTLDRTMKGTDHAASLEPGMMRKLVRDIRNVEQALTYKEKDILDCEIPTREKLKKCL
jgi:N-acetylneuraminate synthase